MENSFNNIEHENVDEKYSSFCSSCNSVLQSICSIGIPSFYELNSENNLISKIEKNEDITKHIGTINVNECTLDHCIEEEIFVKNTDTSKNLMTAMKHHTYEKQEINKNDNKIGCFVTKTFKYIESSPTGPERKKKSIILCDNKNKTFTSETEILKFTKENTSPSNDDILEDIQNHRKEILRSIKSILYLCNYINIMREVILQQIHKKQSNEKRQKVILRDR